MLERHRGCSSSAQERKQKTLSGWQHWLLRKLFPFAALPAVPPLCRALPATGTRSSCQHHPRLNARPADATAPFAESHARRVRATPKAFLSSLQGCLHPVCYSVYHSSAVSYVPARRACPQLSTGPLGWGAARDLHSCSSTGPSRHVGSETTQLGVHRALLRCWTRCWANDLSVGFKYQPALCRNNCWRDPVSICVHLFLKRG